MIHYKYKILIIIVCISIFVIFVHASILFFSATIQRYLTIIQWIVSRCAYFGYFSCLVSLHNTRLTTSSVTGAARFTVTFYAAICILLNNAIVGTLRYLFRRYQLFRPSMNLRNCTATQI